MALFTLSMETCFGVIGLILSTGLAAGAPQFGQRRAPLPPAETLLEPAILRAIDEQVLTPESSAQTAGTDGNAGRILLTCGEGECGTGGAQAERAGGGQEDPSAVPVDSGGLGEQRIGGHRNHGGYSRGRIDGSAVPGGSGALVDRRREVVEVFARRNGFAVEMRPFENLGQLPLDPRGIPTTTIVTNAWTSRDHAAATAAAAAYFLATLPNDGAEALLSHLMVGAHARLAEDGRRAVAQTGPSQRASADVLILMGQAIDREHRRIRSIARFMPAPLDATLASRMADMEKGVASVWTSLGITSSPFVPPAERIRGRGGDDRRVPARVAGAALTADTAVLKLTNRADVCGGAFEQAAHAAAQLIGMQVHRRRQTRARRFGEPAGDVVERRGRPQGLHQRGRQPQEHLFTHARRPWPAAGEPLGDSSSEAWNVDRFQRLLQRNR